MKILKFFVVALVLMCFCTPGLSGTIDFEGMPEEYQYGYGHQNFADYWEGVWFGPDSTVLDRNWPLNYYNYTGYPPHSGDAVLFSYSTPYIDAIFDNAVDEVSMWYTSGNNFYLDAYDEYDNLIATVTGAPNLYSNSLITITLSSYDIKRVRMHDTGNYFTIDDFTAEFVSGQPSGVPEPSTLLLLGFGILGLVGLRRRE